MATQDPLLASLGAAKTPEQLRAANTANVGAGSVDPTITSSSLSPATPITPIQPSYSPTPSISGLDTTTAMSLGTNEKKASDVIASVQALNESLAGRSAYQTEQNTAAGVDTINQAINDNNTAVKQLQNDAAAASLKTEGRQAPMFAIAGEQQQIERTRAIKALTLSSISDALNNNLVAAQHKADAIVEQKYGPLEAEQKAKLANLELILKDPATTLEQANRAEAQKLIEQKRTDEIAQEKTDTAAILKTAQDAATNARSFTATTEYPTVSTALSAISNAKTPAEATLIASKTGLIPQVAQDLQFIPGTANQAAGYFDKATGKFTPTGGGRAQLPSSPANYVAGANPTVDAWAERIYNNNAKITDIPASDKGMRNAVTVALQALGNSLSGGPTVTELGVAAKNTAQDLLNKFDKGQGRSAVGASGFLNSFGYGLIPGTDRANFVTDFNSLKAQLSLDAVKYLKGQGQVSDAERALLAAAVTKLNLSQSEDEFRTTLKGVIDTLNGEKTASNTATIVTAPDGSQVEITD